jgi:hypothetical protein
MPDLWDQLIPGALVTFAKIIIARRYTKNQELRDEARAAELALGERFVQQHGTIQNAHYCANIIGGCALTEKVTKLGRRGETCRTLHTVLNRAAPELVALEATCIALTTKADAVLRGRPSLLPNLRVTTDAVFSAMTRVLRAAAAAGRSAAAPRRSPDTPCRHQVVVPMAMTEHADQATALLAEASRIADSIDDGDDPVRVDSLARSGQIRATAAVSAALLDVAAAIRGSGSPWHGSSR